MTPDSPSVLVVTVVHDPRDARVAVRQIAALQDAGWSVTYAAPFAAYGVDPPQGVRGIDLPVSRGRRRLRGLRAARAVLQREAPLHDVVILHSPELLLAAVGIDHPCVVWDVHEDVPASMSLKPWLPSVVRRPTAWVARRAEGIAERHMHLLLAEHAYQQRFTRMHPVVPNSTFVPSSVPMSGRDRVVYVGHISRARGVVQMIEAARLLHGEVHTHVIGRADAESEALMRQAQQEGVLTWHGYLPNDEALRIVEGATAGLSLLRDEPNYRHSRPTKVYEYLARGVPVISTPLPEAVRVLEASQGGVVVPFDDANEVAAQVRRLRSDDELRHHMARSGRDWVALHANWAIDQKDFITALTGWARASGGR
jgi:glycosyltransferase involved in cell wall biosynthesis